MCQRCVAETQVAADGPQTRDISLPWNNSQIDAARRTFLDRHPLAKNKEQVALAKGEGNASYRMLTTLLVMKRECNQLLGLLWHRLRHVAPEAASHSKVQA